MLATVRLYSYALVVSVWAVIVTLGGRSDTLTGFMLALVAVTAVIAERERSRRRQGIRR